MDRLGRELLLVESAFRELQVAPDRSWFIIFRWSLEVGWNKSETAVLVQIPPGHPVAPPDNFFTDADLRLASNTEPGNSGGGPTIAERAWRQFSYHVEGSDWRPHAEPEKGHNLLTFLDGVRRRLAEAN